MLAEGVDMNATWRWSVLVSMLLVLAVSVGLARTHATSRPTVAAIMATINRSATIAVLPGRADAENTFIVAGTQGAAVRLISRSLDMNMGTTTYAASRLADGRWQVANVEVPMVGRWGITVQVQPNGAWVTVGEVAYSVPFTGTMHLVAVPGQK
jgi:hypothetical protein